MSKTKTGDDELTFGAAIEELESILRRVEDDGIDIDELAEELERAAELLEICRAKIRRAEVEVSQIVQTLEEPATPPVPLDEPEPDAEAAAGETANLFGHES
ncbi:MAG: exodeoxyribonuclease VII small subunit [Acidobacteria bacterium]|nr:exodeoxyribonuclease VII small subunit [Acidobacteriota bacterium]